MDYREAWRVRKIQLIVVNAIFLIIGIGTAIGDKNIAELFPTWILGAWIVGTIVASFSKTGGRLSSMAKNVFSTMIIGTLGAAFEGTGSMFFAVTFMIALIKAMVGMVVFFAALAFELILYPISSIYYFAKSRG